MGINSIFDFSIELFLLFPSFLGWKTHKSAIAEGQRIYYNFVKPHEVYRWKDTIRKSWNKKAKNSFTNLLTESMRFK